MDAIILNGASTRSIEDFHHAIKSSLNHPYYYGENLDALWDCLTGYIELPVKIIWKDFETSKSNLTSIQEVVNLFNEAGKELNGFVVE